MPTAEVLVTVQRIDSMWTVIPAGGSGTRLWPLSRSHRPKFLLPLAGQRSLLQSTWDRTRRLSPPDQTLVVAGSAHAAEIARQLPEIPVANILVEPAPRGSGPAIGLAAALIARRDPEAIMGSFAADHIVSDPDAFAVAVGVAAAAADAGWLTTIGITPSRSETGYGYISRTDEILARANGLCAFRADRFVEKPNAALATEYVRSGTFLWNASMFIWRVSTFLDELRRQQPDLAAGLDEVAALWNRPNAEDEISSRWLQLESVSIDEGIMERAERVAVVPADFGWSDVGDWHGLGELLTREVLGVDDEGRVIQHDAHRCIVWSSTGRAIALVGVEDLAVVDTPDALLVLDRGHAQDVRKIVETLRQRGLDLT